MISIGVVGSRRFNDEWLVRATICAVPLVFRDFEIVSGGAGGVDSWAIDEARQLKLNAREIKAEWTKFGKKAGMLRNDILVRACDYVILFWDGISPGTKNTLSLVKKNEVPYRLIRSWDGIQSS